jgi:hypothetical protein
MHDGSHEKHSGERGFALILAILSLMLLTFLGLTLATTTSTELQIATNYRWSQQALYNAEAGLEAARIALSNIADPTAYWQTQLPVFRGGSWPPGGAPAHEAPVAPRDFEKDGCDTTGGMGYGRVLNDGVTLFEDVSTFPTGAGGQTLNGAFTVWVRRPLRVGNNGQYSDTPDNDRLVIVAEGVAPYSGPGDAFTRTRQATRVLETRFTLALGEAGNPCLGNQQGQEGGSPMGENFSACAPVTAGASGSLANAFGGVPGAGTLDGTGNR